MAQGVILGQTPNTNNLLPLDGSRAMTGRLQANGGITISAGSGPAILNTSPSSRNLNIALGDVTVATYASDSVTFNKLLDLVNNGLRNVSQIYNSDDQSFVIRVTDNSTITCTVGSTPTITISNTKITNNVPIAMSNQKITGLANGIADTDAATVGQVKTLLSNQIPYIIHSSGNCIVSPTSAYLYKDGGNNVSYRFTDDEANIIASWLNINHNTSAWPILNLYSVDGKSIGEVDIKSELVIFTISQNYVGTVLYYWN